MDNKPFVIGAGLRGSVTRVWEKSQSQHDYTSGVCLCKECESGRGFDQALASIGQDFNATLERAKAAMRYVQSCNRIGILSKREYQREMARVSRCIKDAIYAYRLMVKGNTAAQTFGGAL